MWLAWECIIQERIIQEYIAKHNNAAVHYRKATMWLLGSAVWIDPTNVDTSEGGGISLLQCISFVIYFI